MTDPTLQDRLRECANGIGNPKNDRGDYGLYDDAADAAQARIQMRLNAIREAIDLRDYDAAYALTLIPVAALEDRT